MMIVGVMASGDESLAKKHEILAKEVGSAIAETGFHLLTGGGSGLMRAVGQEFLNRAPRTGKLISILRAKELPQLKISGRRNWQPSADNGFGEIVIRTHLPYSGTKGLDPLSRNHINALSSDFIVVLPGGSGTLSELQLAWEYRKDVMIYLGNDGNVDGQTPMQLKAKFSGDNVVVGISQAHLSEWLQNNSSDR
jgi:predicted Rossmann-fold nucleotide-binding protein